jgi:hypothetical protein
VFRVLKSKKYPRIANLGRAIVLFGLSGFFPGVIIFWGVQDYLQAQASLEWPRAEGEITRSEIRSKRSYCANKQYCTKHYLWFSYRFYVNGKEYQDEGGYFETGNKNQLNPIAKIYKKSKKLPIFYNSSDPNENVLQRGGIAFWNGPTVFGVGLLIVVWAICLLIWLFTPKNEF